MHVTQWAQIQQTTIILFVLCLYFHSFIILQEGGISVTSSDWEEFIFGTVPDVDYFVITAETDSDWVITELYGKGCEKGKILACMQNITLFLRILLFCIYAH